MKVVNITALKEVQADLDDGAQFYDLSELGIGVYFRDSVIADIESLRLYAGIHEKHFGLYRMLATRFPFAIYYFIQNNTAVVVAVVDMRRSPHWIRRQLKERRI